MASTSGNELAGAILAVEDTGRRGAALTERLGASLYARLLEAGGYAEVVTEVGRDDLDGRVRAALQTAVQRQPRVDVFLSIHETERDPEAWRDLGAGRLGLVYSTACRGESLEREAWIAAGAQTVVTFPGTNDSVLAAPQFLAGWVCGQTVQEAAEAGYAETEAGHAWIRGLWGGRARGLPPSSESRPVVWGDAELRKAGAPAPGWARWSRRDGGVVGLGVRALDGAFAISPLELRALGDRSRVGWPDALFDGLQGLEPRRGALEVRWRRPTTLRWPGGVWAELGPRARLTPGVFDPHAQTVALSAEGIRVGWGPMWARLTEVTLRSEPGWHHATVSGKAFGMAPVRRSFEWRAPD